MSRHWSSRATLEAYYRAEGFVLGHSYCPDCHQAMPSAWYPQTPRAGLDCLLCHGQRVGLFEEVHATPPTCQSQTPTS